MQTRFCDRSEFVGKHVRNSFFSVRRSLVATSEKDLRWIKCMAVIVRLALRMHLRPSGRPHATATAQPLKLRMESVMKQTGKKRDPYGPRNMLKKVCRVSWWYCKELRMGYAIAKKVFRRNGVFSGVKQ